MAIELEQKIKSAILDILWSLGTISPRDVYAALPQIKENTIRMTLVRMAENGIIVKRGFGKYTVRNEFTEMRAHALHRRFKVSLHNLWAKCQCPTEKLLPKLHLLGQDPESGWHYYPENKAFVLHQQLLQDVEVTVTVNNTGLVVVQSRNSKPTAGFDTFQEFAVYENLVTQLLKCLAISYKKFGYYGYDFAVDDFQGHYDGSIVQSPLFGEYMLKFYQHEEVFRKEERLLAGAHEVPREEIKDLLAPDGKRHYTEPELHDWMDGLLNHAAIAKNHKDNKFLYQRFTQEAANYERLLKASQSDHTATLEYLRALDNRNEQNTSKINEIHHAITTGNLNFDQLTSQIQGIIDSQLDNSQIANAVVATHKAVVKIGEQVEDLTADIAEIKLSIRNPKQNDNFERILEVLAEVLGGTGTTKEIARCLELQVRNIAPYLTMMKKRHLISVFRRHGREIEWKVR